ncbi:hypothetical protein PO124_26000 [Bacillus licheniformis]|nr:hypothetical protein [Bacillus licheniformis]
MRAVENFPITGYQIDEELIKALAMVKKRRLSPTWILNVYIKSLAKSS